jgi:CO/xanthine dehydrogenase FAD-binding subunit
MVAMPTSYLEAALALDSDPHGCPVAGGTDVMVGVNEGTRQVRRWVALHRIAGARDVEHDAGRMRLGAGTTFEQILRHHAHDLPALAQAARTVGGPQIRAAGTIGGNVATASPAGDSLPVLLCHDTSIEVVGPTATRHQPLAEFLVAPKTNDLVANEVIAAVVLESTGGAQFFAKVGTRNAMVISVCSLAGRLDRSRGIARLAIGSAAPTARRDHAAEALLLDGAPPADVGAALAANASPIDDHRATAAYRRHALGVLGERMTRWLREHDHG